MTNHHSRRLPPTTTGNPRYEYRGWIIEKEYYGGSASYYFWTIRDRSGQIRTESHSLTGAKHQIDTYEEATPPMTPRTVAYVDANLTDPENPERHIVVLFEENVPGWVATQHTGPLEYCRRVADHLNTQRGIDPHTVQRIVMSSMWARLPRQTRRR